MTRVINIHWPIILFGASTGIVPIIFGWVPIWVSPYGPVNKWKKGSRYISLQKVVMAIVFIRSIKIRQDGTGWVVTMA
ncbi:hypothetical protein D3C80_1977940 [compost metagenome]